jgi:hypothetical protein
MSRLVQQIRERSERDLANGNIESGSWHEDYRGVPWIFIGNVPLASTESDIRRIFAQYGTILTCTMRMDSTSGKFTGVVFLEYADWRSTVLAVDNLNGFVWDNRSLRVDHTRVPA